jgi:glycosyltransferase involved in cell wall biosynthesis
MSSMQPRVSALMPVFNAECFVAEALDSALAQRFDALEVVVVNDGSSDRSAEIVRRVAARDARVRLVEQDNAGLPAARNAAIALARGQYLALLDADDVWLPEHLQRAVEVLDGNASIGLVHAGVECIDEASVCVGYYTRRGRAALDSYRALALRHEHVCCPTAVFRASCIRHVGGFDLRYTGLGCEDRDLWLRIAEHYRIHYIDAISARYRVHAGSMSRNAERMAQAREVLLAKLATSRRGAPLVRHARAMIESDLGMDLMAEGRPKQALMAQFRALRIRPHTPRVWRRTLRPAFSLVSALIFGI